VTGRQTFVGFSGGEGRGRSVGHVTIFILDTDPWSSGQ